MSVPLRYMESGRRPPRRRRRRPRIGRGPRRPRRPRRLLPLALLAALVGGGAVAAVLIVSHQRRERAERRVVESFARGWEGRDYGAMYDQLDPASRGRVSRLGFARAY